MVYASDLSVPAIIDAIRAGHVFIDLTGSRDRVLEFSASAGERFSSSGDVLAAPANAAVQVIAHIFGCKGSSAIFLIDGHTDSALAATAIQQNDAMIRLSWTSDGQKHWLRPEVRTPEGKLQLLGNPIYINYPN